MGFILNCSILIGHQISLLCLILLATLLILGDLYVNDPAQSNLKHYHQLPVEDLHEVEDGHGFWCFLGLWDIDEDEVVDHEDDVLGEEDVHHK